jgi:hypothetical protein
MKAILWDDDYINAMSEDELTAYVENRDNYGTIIWHKYGWGFTFVTGHKYKFHFGLLGTNFVEM